MWFGTISLPGHRTSHDFRHGGSGGAIRVSNPNLLRASVGQQRKWKGSARSRTVVTLQEVMSTTVQAIDAVSKGRCGMCESRHTT